MTVRDQRTIFYEEVHLLSNGDPQVLECGGYNWLTIQSDTAAATNVGGSLDGKTFYAMQATNLSDGVDGAIAGAGLYQINISGVGFVEVEAATSDVQAVIRLTG